MRATPSRARSLLSTGLREARWLHSRERRLVGDGIRRVVEGQALLDARSGHASPTDLHRWVGWLVDEGLPAEAAAAVVPEVAWDQRPPPESVLQGLSEAQAVARLGSFHLGFAEMLLEALGEQTPSFLRACRQRAAIDLRTQGVEAERVLESLATDGIETSLVDGIPGALRVAGRANLPATEAWSRGWFEVQDAGSQLVAALVDPDDGPIIDLCAGAGGKTLALGAAAPHARLIAADVRSHALDELRRRARRAQLASLWVVHLRPNGDLPAKLSSTRASRVLVDAPCSGSGTLRRHPELRLRLTPAVVEENRRLQREILDRAASLVQPGGRLIYATCSVLRAENQDTVEHFLAKHRAFSRIDAAQFVDARFCVDGDLQVSPHLHGLDGFYGAVLARRPA